MPDVLPLLDPEIAAKLALLDMDFAALTTDTLVARRATMAEVPAAPPSEGVTHSDHDIPGRPGVVVRVHRPLAGSATPRPCVYWIHGGGYVMGSYTGEDRRLQRWCQTLDCVAVAIEYRLAPEYPFPVPLEDCYEGLKWTLAHASDLGIDAGRLGIGGASAGGGLAAALALLVRDRGELQIGFQMLVYPMIDDRFLTESSTWNDPVWPAAAGRFGWTAYLTGLGDDVPYHAAPSRAIDLTGLPPTLVYVGALDTLCDEDVEYATRLRHAGVATELMVYAGAPHGFDGMAPGSAISRRARRHSDEWLAGVMRAKRDGGS